MSFFVYLLISFNKKKKISYVGYTKDLKKRLKLHNSSKGAKFTKGKRWIMIYNKPYSTKSIAMKEEIKLKKDYKKRKIIKDNYLKFNEKTN